MELLESKRVYEGFGIDVEVQRHQFLDGEVEHRVVDRSGGRPVR